MSAKTWFQLEREYDKTHPEPEWPRWASVATPALAGLAGGCITATVRLALDGGPWLIAVFATVVLLVAARWTFVKAGDLHHAAWIEHHRAKDSWLEDHAHEVDR